MNIQVKFGKGRPYTYIYEGTETIKVGDKVLAPVGSEGEFKQVVVFAVDVFAPPGVTLKKIIEKVEDPLPVTE